MHLVTTFFGFFQQRFLLAFLNDEIDIAPPKVTVVEKPVAKESKFNKLKDPCNKIRLTTGAIIAANATIIIDTNPQSI